VKEAHKNLKKKKQRKIPNISRNIAGIFAPTVGQQWSNFRALITAASPFFLSGGL